MKDKKATVSTDKGSLEKKGHTFTVERAQHFPHAIKFSQWERAWPKISSNIRSVRRELKDK